MSLITELIKRQVYKPYMKLSESLCIDNLNFMVKIYHYNLDIREKDGTAEKDEKNSDDDS